MKYSPVEIGKILEGMDGLEGCAIVPYPDPVLGERACIFVVEGGTDANISLADVLAFLEHANVAKFKWPERLEVIEELPLTPTLKVMRGRLTNLLREN